MQPIHAEPPETTFDIRAVIDQDGHIVVALASSGVPVAVVTHMIDSPYLRHVHLTDSGAPAASPVVDEFRRKVAYGHVVSCDASTIITFTRAEAKYASLLARLIDAPSRPNRTITPTRSLFARTVRFPLYDGRGPILPLITLKRTAVRAVIHELLWFLRASTDTSYLRANDVHIWDGNTTREALDARGLSALAPGECGPIYGCQWRAWPGAVSARCSDPPPHDQLANVISALKVDPLSRRHVVSAWNVDQLNNMALPPCHYAYQFLAEPIGGGNASDRLDYSLHCVVTMRSADIALGVPFNIASYALLTHMVANLVSMRPGSVSINMADCHVYEDHIDGVKLMLTRQPRRSPTITMPSAQTIDEYAAMTPDQFVIGDYKPHPAIKLNMAV